MYDKISSLSPKDALPAPRLSSHKAPGKLWVETGCACEDSVVQISNTGNVPIQNGLIESGGISEHANHRYDIRCVPFSKWLVEMGRTFEHSIHRYDIGCVLYSKLLVETGGAFEHIIHIARNWRCPIQQVAG